MIPPWGWGREKRMGAWQGEIMTAFQKPSTKRVKIKGNYREKVSCDFNPGNI